METILNASAADLLAAHNTTFTVSGLRQRTDATPLGLITIDGAEAPLYKINVQVRWTGSYGKEALALDTTVLP